jgi:hypothetical protein
VFDTLTFADKAMWRIDQFLNSAGKAPEPGTALSLDSRMILGWVVYAEIVHTKKDKDDPRYNPKFPIDVDVACYIKSDNPIHPGTRRGEAAPPPPPPPPPPADDVDDGGDCPF